MREGAWARRESELERKGCKLGGKALGSRREGDISWKETLTEDNRDWERRD